MDEIDKIRGFYYKGDILVKVPEKMSSFEKIQGYHYAETTFSEVMIDGKPVYVERTAIKYVEPDGKALMRYLCKHDPENWQILEGIELLNDLETASEDDRNNGKR